MRVPQPLNAHEPKGPQVPTERRGTPVVTEEERDAGEAASEDVVVAGTPTSTSSCRIKAAGTEARGEIDDAGIGHGAVFLRAVDGERDEAGRGHLLSDQSAIVTSATKAGSRTA